MKHHLFLFFLSTASWDRAASDIRSTTYQDGIGRCYATNESAIRFLDQTGIRFDRMFYFETNSVRRPMDMPGHAESHLAFFQQRLHDILPQIGTLLHPVPYDETAGIPNMMTCVLRMSEAIQSYVRGLPAGDTALLHADFTGGMRHANMMMLAVLRLLQYSGIEIGALLYSDYQSRRVEDIHSIYNLFDLISGAEEFVNFGSVKAINGYFQHRAASPVLQRLLDAMRDFSDEIGLCHRGRLIRAAQSLRDALLSFRAEKTPGIDDRLMHALETRITSDYQELLQRDVDDIQLIRWCLHHQNLQQALTLYTECVPELLFQRRMVSLTENGNRCIRTAYQEKKRPEDFHFYALVKYVPQPTTDATKKARTSASQYKNKLPQEWKNIVNDIRKGHAPSAEEIRRRIQAAEQKQSRLATCNPGHMYQAFEILKQWKEHPELLAQRPETEEAAALYDTLTALLQKRCQWTITDNGTGNCNRFLKFIVSSAVEEDMAELFSNVCETYAAHFLQSVDAGLAELSIPQETFCSILNTYGFLKHERNSSNHAHKSEDEFVLSASQLKNAILDGLEEIEHARP